MPWTYFIPDDPPDRLAQPASSPGPTQRRPHAPAQFRLKKRHHQLAPSVGTTVPVQVKTDHSVTKRINSEHKQEPRQSAKDAGSARRRRQQTSWDSRSNASQYERSGSTSPRQSTPDRRIRTTYQADATSTGDMTDPGRS